MAKIEDWVLSIDWVEKGLEKYRDKSLSKKESTEFLLLFYLKLLFGPVKYNLAMLFLLAVSFYKESEPWAISVLIGLMLALPLIPISKVLRLSKASKKGRLDAEAKITYSNPYPQGSDLADAYERSYYGASRSDFKES
ncbi:TPA: hypothetical protein ACGSTL_001278 [Vibrio parahaemolyticus]|jgi:hypothetical protein|uniref:hypothetical protein n=1 Tax=Vibrio campbellii TaxID=680 RepID=UPI001F073341|nr:hypothetical protein [Vibrio campbellii]UMM06696.1 hypothetical protein MKR81_27495 [Vibrio campbellii]